MAARSPRPGLTGAIIVILLVALCVLVAVLFVVVPRQADTYLTDTLWERGKAVAKEIERKVPIAAREGLDSEASAEINNIVGGERAIRNVWVLVCRGECRPEHVIAESHDTAAKTTSDVLAQFNAQGQRVQIQLESGELLVADPVPLKGGAQGFVLVSLDRARIDEGLGSLRRTLLIALIVSVLIFMALIGVLSRLLLIAPLATMRQMAMRLAEADLSGRVEGAPTRELDELADSLNSIGQGLRDTLGRVRGVAERVAEVIDQISRSASTTTSGASTVLTRVEETSSAMVQMLSSLKGIAESHDTAAKTTSDVLAQFNAQ
ncbi:MAG TPA: methyl-accepting chemotaxis protein, partial [Archangium sp.]